MALRASDCSGWPRRWVRDNGAIGTQEEPAVFRRNTRALRVLRDSGLVSGLGGADHEDRQVGVQVRMLEHLCLGFSIEGDAPMDPDVLLAAEVLEIGNGEEPDIGRVVPFVVQDAGGLRRSPGLGQHAPELVIAKVRDADDAGPADANHLRQDALHVLHGLQGLGQDHAVKLPGSEGAQTGVSSHF